MVSDPIRTFLERKGADPVLQNMTESLTLQTLRISFRRGSIVLGPLQQFRPTTSAPASSSCLQASGKVKPSLVLSSTCGAKVTTAGTAVQKINAINVSITFLTVAPIFSINSFQSNNNRIILVSTDVESTFQNKNGKTVKQLNVFRWKL